MGENDNGAVERNRNRESGDLEPVARLADDMFYRALATATRRRILYYLLENGTSTVTELAKMLAGWEASTEREMKTPERHRRITTALDHTHLPLLCDAGLVTYEREAGSVSLEPIEQPVADLIASSIEAEQ